MNLIADIKSRKGSVLILTLIVALVLSTTFISSAVTAYGMTTNYYEVTLGDESIAIVATEEEANAMIDTVKEHYLTEGAVLKAITIDPEMKVEMLTVKMMDEQPELTENPQAVIEEILAGDSAVDTYEVQAGDTLWAIAAERDTYISTILEENPSIESEDSLMPGDVIVFSTVEAKIHVTTEEEIVSVEEVAYETVYEDTDELEVGEEEVKTEGQNGSRSVTSLVTSVNGVYSESVELSSEEITAPVTEVILRGTREPEPEVVEEEVVETSSNDTYADTSSSSSSNSGSNTTPTVISTYGDIQSTVLSAAYSQLGANQDCTMLVTNSLAAAGIYFHGWPQQYASLGSWTSSPVPGDIIIYDTHVAVYAGGSTAVHGGWFGYTTAEGPVYCSANLIGYIHIG